MCSGHATVRVCDSMKVEIIFPGQCEIIIAIIEKIYGKHLRAPWHHSLLLYLNLLPLEQSAARLANKLFHFVLTQWHISS